MISARKLASAIGVDRASGLATAASMAWPPSQPLSLRQIAWTLGHPLEPADLGFSWDVDAAGKPIVHPPTSTSLPADRDVSLLWTDPGDGLRKARAWALRIRVASTGQDIPGSPFALQSAGFGDRFPANGYEWVVTPSNDYGEGPSSPEFPFASIPAPQPPPPNPPPPHGGVLTLQVRISIPANQQAITKAAWQVTGPGAPTTPQVAHIAQSGLEGDVTLALPPPPAGQPSVSYVVQSTAAFHYDALTGPGGVTGPEDTQVDLSRPVQISWTGQALTGLFSIHYDGFNNVFTYTYDGVL